MKLKQVLVPSFVLLLFVWYDIFKVQFKQAVF